MRKIGPWSLAIRRRLRGEHQGNFLGDVDHRLTTNDFCVTFLPTLKDRVVIYDGAMGTIIQPRKPVWTISAAS
jgi:hypothetical protein